MKFQELAEKWFDEYAVVNLKKSSVQRLRGVTKRIYSAFGHIRVDKITRGQIQAFIDDLARKGEPYKWQKKLTEEHGMKFCDIHSLRLSGILTLRC